VEAGYLGQSESLANRDDRRVGGSQRQALVDQNQLPRAAVIIAGEVDRLQRSVRQRVQKLRLDSWATLPGQHIPDLGGDGARYQKGSTGSVQPGEQVNAVAVTGVVF